MTLNQYQDNAMTTCLESANNITYMLTNLVGEVGEFSSKVAKAIRKEDIFIRHNGLVFKSELMDGDDPRFADQNDKEWKLLNDLRSELGDILWQTAGLAKVLGYDLESVAEQNLMKLQQRKTYGTINGSGDGVTKEERL